MPSSADRAKESGGVKPMSASDEKKLDKAIELATEFADSKISSPTAEPSKPGENGGSARINSGSKKKSPRSERRSFTDEIAALPTSANEDLPPESQAAYNMLVVKGSVKEREQEEDRERLYKQSRDWRRRRAMEHQEAQSTENPAAVPVRNGTGRPVNKNIRKPAGIPGRGTATTGDGEVDTNPLRRLRESQSLIGSKVPRFPGRTPSEPLSNGENAHVNARRPNLNANLPFFAKLKEQEQEQQESDDNEGIANPVALPPRQPLRPATINAKPRERKYPLDLSSYNDRQKPAQTTSTSASTCAPRRMHSSSSSSQQDALPPPPPPPPPADGTENEVLNSTAESSDSVFLQGSLGSASTSSSLDRQQLVGHSSYSPGQDSAFPSSPFSVKSVKVTAADLGLYDNSDMFWQKEVNFCALGSDPDTSPLPGRYKTSDNVSYEDLMEFALDADDASEATHENHNPKRYFCLFCFHFIFSDFPLLAVEL